MTCQTCNGERVIHVAGKTDDKCSVSATNQYALQMEAHGYVPRKINIGGGDYLTFDLCLDCGQMQGEWPVEPED